MASRPGAYQKTYGTFLEHRLSFPRAQLFAAFASYQPSSQEDAQVKDVDETLREISSNDAHIDSRRLSATQSYACITDFAELARTERLQHEIAMQQIQRTHRDQLERLSAMLAKTGLSTFDVEVPPSASVDEKLETFLNAAETRLASTHEKLEKTNMCLNSIRSALDNASTPLSNEQKDAPLDNRVRALVECLNRLESALTTGSSQLWVASDGMSVESKLETFIGVALERSTNRDQYLEELKDFINKAFQAAGLQKPSSEEIDSTSSRDAIRDWQMARSAELCESIKKSLQDLRLASSSTFHGKQTPAITGAGFTPTGIALDENDLADQRDFDEPMTGLDQSFSGASSPQAKRTAGSPVETPPSKKPVRTELNPSSSRVLTQREHEVL